MPNGIPYTNFSFLFWLFIAGSLLGMLLEGIFCIVRKQKWETHTVTIWGPFCIVYGIGAVVFYLGAIYYSNLHLGWQFVLFSADATVIEYVCGALLRYGLRMKAWDYSKNFLDLQGLICLKMTLVWGAAGVLFARYIVPEFSGWYEFFRNPICVAFTFVFAVFMAINFIMTFLCIVRWAKRHRGIAAKTRLGQYIDHKYDDEKMEKRFCEWIFLVDEDLNRKAVIVFKY